MSTQALSIIDELIENLNSNTTTIHCPIDTLMYSITEYNKVLNDSILNKISDFIGRKKYIVDNNTYCISKFQLLHFLNDLKVKLNFPELLVIDDAKKELYPQLLEQIDAIQDNSNMDNVYNELAILLYVWEEINNKFEDRCTTPFFEFTADDYNRKETIEFSTILNNIIDNDDDFEINRKILLLLEEFKNQVKKGDDGVCGYRFDW